MMFHEMTHAAHFAKVGESWWNDFVYSECFTITKHVFNPNNQPYGLGDDGAISDIISVGESWAEHVARMMSDQRYQGVSSFPQNQSFLYRNGDIVQGNVVVAVTGLRPHLNLLEDFSPFRTFDVQHWIPYGLYYDMIDNRNDENFFRVDIADQVNLYTNQQLFQALDPNVKSMPQHRARVLSENNNNQALEVNLLFQGYGY